jgi:NAD-dependent deacetylase
MPAEKLVVLSGSGISQESGLKTFRDEGGLWEGYNVYEVATFEAWQRDPEMVLEFYNQRRRQAAETHPNEAHKALVKLEEKYDVTVVTQNIDDLHERAGSSKVLHLHGEITKARSIADDNLIVDIGYKDLKLGDTASDGQQLRPHIVWFGEMVPMIEHAAVLVSEADYLVVIGTSLQVYPAAGLVDLAAPHCRRFIVDPKIPDGRDFGWTAIPKKAVEGSVDLLNHLLNE